MPLHQQQQQMWPMHVGAPPHFHRTVKEHLNPTSGEQWLGRGGTVNWPARSHKLNSLYFWLWEQLNALLYSASNTDLEVLQQRVLNACQEIRVKPGIPETVRTSVGRRAECLVEIHWNHTEHVLRRSHEHRPYLSRHWFLGIC